MLYIHIHVYCIYTLYTYIYNIYHIILIRMAIKKPENNKCWWGCGETGTLYTYDVHYRKQYDSSSKNQVYDVYLLCEMYLLSLKIFIFVSFRKKIKVELP